MIIAGYTYITHKLILRPWGSECRYTVRKPDGGLIDDVVPVKSMGISQADLIAIVSSRLAQMKEREDYEALKDHFFDYCGREVREALVWMVRKIRNNPNATLTQAQTAWDAEWAESIFTFTKLVTFLRSKIGNITWEQFKAYVINHHFEGAD